MSASDWFLPFRFHESLPAPDPKRQLPIMKTEFRKFLDQALLRGALSA